VYNSAALIDPRGEVIGVYRKTHLFPTEKKKRGRGGARREQSHRRRDGAGSIGLMICYDGDFRS